MRLLRLALPVLAFVAAGTWATPGTACDDSKSTSAASAKKSTACSAAMAAQCTAEMAGSCHAKGTSAASASAASCANKSSAAAYASSSNASCASKSSTAANDHCAGAKTSAVTASSQGSSAARDKAKPSAIDVGSGSCNGRGMTTAVGRSAHGDCDACADMAMCYEELEAAGTRTQIVPLKNGVMFVYTADNPGKVNLVQTAMARRSERLAQIVSAGDKAHLCPECKSIRGAMASGKMTREVVNIEGGALTLMTSNDPAVVAKIHAMVENHKNSRSKI